MYSSVWNIKEILNVSNGGSKSSGRSGATSDYSSLTDSQFLFGSQFLSEQTGLSQEMSLQARNSLQNSQEVNEPKVSTNYRTKPYLFGGDSADKSKVPNFTCGKTRGILEQFEEERKQAKEKTESEMLMSELSHLKECMENMKTSLSSVDGNINSTERVVVEALDGFMKTFQGAVGSTQEGLAVQVGSVLNKLNCQLEALRDMEDRGSKVVSEVATLATGVHGLQRDLESLRTEQARGQCMMGEILSVLQALASAKPPSAPVADSGVQTSPCPWERLRLISEKTRYFQSLELSAGPAPQPQGESANPGPLLPVEQEPGQASAPDLQAAAHTEPGRTSAPNLRAAARTEPGRTSAPNLRAAARTEPGRTSAPDLRAAARTEPGRTSAPDLQAAAHTEPGRTSAPNLRAAAHTEPGRTSAPNLRAAAHTEPGRTSAPNLRAAAHTEPGRTRAPNLRAAAHTEPGRTSAPNLRAAAHTEPGRTRAPNLRAAAHTEPGRAEALADRAHETERSGRGACCTRSAAGVPGGAAGTRTPDTPASCSQPGAELEKLAVLPEAGGGAPRPGGAPKRAGGRKRAVQRGHRTRVPKRRRKALPLPGGRGNGNRGGAITPSRPTSCQIPANRMSENAGAPFNPCGGWSQDSNGTQFVSGCETTAASWVMPLSEVNAGVTQKGFWQLFDFCDDSD